MFGSDWPVCELRGDYERVVEALAEILGGRPAEMFGGTAVRVYGLEMR
jgi:L-fuconolactonase